MSLSLIIRNYDNDDLLAKRKSLYLENKYEEEYPSLENEELDDFSLNDVWSGDISSSLMIMASKTPIVDQKKDDIDLRKSNLYYYLWKPNEIGFDYLDNYYINGIKEAYRYFCNNENYLKKFKVKKEKEGTYDDLGSFLRSLIKFFDIIDDINYSDEYQLISISK